MDRKVLANGPQNLSIEGRESLNLQDLRSGTNLLAPRGNF